MVDVFPLEVDVTEAMYEEMVKRATEFMQANGPMPWERFVMLSDTSIAAFREARTRLVESKAILG